ncbi:MAG: NTP transferase domain-containing protein, partial [Chloroflexota bacterium]
MDAMITAGGIPEPDEALYQYSQGESKGMVDILGKPMVQWILDALSTAKNIDNVIIVGLNKSHGLTCDKPVYYVPNQGGMISNIRAGAEKVVKINPESQHVMLVSSDIPTITSEMVDWVASTALETDDDLYFNYVRKDVMETRFPGSKRTFTKLKGMELCGSDINVVKTWTIAAKAGLWNKLEATRKNPLKQVAMIGFDTLFLIMFRLVDAHGAAKQISKRLKLKARA